jgi:predicted RNase H-like HicB family nuclease
MTSYYRLVLETGTTRDDDNHPVTWAACPDLPGAYAEAATEAEAVAALRALAVQIIAEHLLREDPLDPDIIGADAPLTEMANALLVTITDEDMAAAREAPMLYIEVPEP